MRNASPLSLRIYFPIYSRRPYRNRISKLITGYCSPRYLLRCSPLPLCSINRRCLCDYCGVHPLIPSVYRVYTSRHMNKNPLWCNICRSQSHILSSTLPWPSWNTSPILRLPRCLHTVKYSLINRLYSISDWGNSISLYYLRSLRRKTRSSRSDTYLKQSRMTVRLPSTISHI